MCVAGTYKASLLRAYERTVREARFALVIVDAPNLYADDLKPYWTAGQVRVTTKYFYPSLADPLLYICCLRYLAASPLLFMFVLCLSWINCMSRCVKDCGSGD